MNIEAGNSRVACAGSGETKILEFFALLPLRGIAPSDVVRISYQVEDGRKVVQPLEELPSRQ